MMRPQEPRAHRLVSWEEVDQLIDELVPRIQHLGPFGAMVMITRGGVIPGGLLAEALSIRRLLTASVDFQSTEQSGIMAWPTFLQFPDPDLLRGRRTLIVDDVWGSGRTSICRPRTGQRCRRPSLQLRTAFQSISLVVFQYPTRPVRRRNRCLRGISLGNRQRSFGTRLR